MERRVICWFSAGAASAVATKLALRKFGPDRVVIAYTDPGSEHLDNERFMRDCEAWFGQPITRLKSDKYRDTWDVWERRGLIRTPKGGAPCTGELKRVVRFAFQKPFDIQVFGYTAEERKRAERFREQNFEIDLRTPLIDAGLTKADTLAIIERAGIALPAMYLMGYNNNNCIGCPKGGMGYWNKIRRDFPEVFNRAACLERRLGNSIFSEDGKALYLDELDPSRGKHDEPSFECSLMCHMAEQDLADSTL